MPAHFTHIYTARLVADQLINGEFPDWPHAEGALSGRDPRTCGEVMKKWEKFTAIGAIGPDLFYFSQDWNNSVLGPVSDELMLAFAVYYFTDTASENDWEPLLIILDEANSQLADLIRFLLKLQKIWDNFVAGWNATLGPFVKDIEHLADALTGGILSEGAVVLNELKLALKELAEQELVTFTDIFGKMNTCVQKGYGEKLFLWSDMSHYRRPSALCQALMRQVDALATGGKAEEAEQFLAFSLGYITHLGIDTVAHSFVNEQCGGPYRNHPQRHHLIESHIDSFNYYETREGGKLAADPWGFSDEYASVSQSALWFAIQLTPDNPHGEQRPTGPFDDDDARQAALDVDGELPDWMANAFVLAMMDCYQDPEEHPHIYQGDTFQNAIDEGVLTEAFKLVTGGGLDRPFDDLLKAIAPKPSFEVREGFPLPWEVKTIYKIMYTFYRLIYNGSWELEKPKRPEFIIFPPASDVEDLFQPPDLSGIDFSNPVAGVCEAIVALFEWAVKEIEAAINLIADLIMMLTSPFSYPIRLGFYKVAMLVWDVVTKTHELLAHTGFFSPHPAAFYPGGELRLPNEIDLPLITLGGTVDSAFRQALAAAFDPFGNLDRDQDVIGTGHSVTDRNTPYYPVLRWKLDGTTEDWEYKRPWAWPDRSPVEHPGGPDTLRATPTETYNPFKSFGEGPDAAFKPLTAGPYQIGAQPDVFFRVDAPVDEAARRAYEQCQSPWETDVLNSRLLERKGLGNSPIGDPIPFSCHLIGQLANDTGYSTQWNLDSDRAFAYLTWDWIRNDKVTDHAGGALNLSYHPPVEAPQGAETWAQGINPLLLTYKDPPRQRRAPPPR